MSVSEELKETISLKREKANSAKNKQTAFMTSALTSFFCILLPLSMTYYIQIQLSNVTIIRQTELWSIASTSILIICVAYMGIVCYVWYHLHLKYKEYNGDYYMFLAVNFLEKLRKGSIIKNINASVIKTVSDELSRKLRLDERELFCELMEYYKDEIKHIKNPKPAKPPFNEYLKPLIPSIIISVTALFTIYGTTYVENYILKVILLVFSTSMFGLALLTMVRFRKLTAPS